MLKDISAQKVKKCLRFLNLLNGNNYAKDKIWINDGSIQKRILKNLPIPEGFVRGRLNFKMSPRQQITCPHCELTGDATNMKRYHFDNCKRKTVNIIS